jgi:hypothetical protein
MGLSIYYGGKIKEAALLPELVMEVKDICEVYQWPHQIYETEFPEENLDSEEYDNKIYGICFTPPDCETIDLCFLSNGRMSSEIKLELFGKHKNVKEESYMYQLFVKTQFAGPELHQLIIHLFKYLSEKYFDDFHLTDDGKYWETGDAELLKRNFNIYSSLIDSVSSTFEHFPIRSNETIDDYVKRLVKIVNDKKDERK